MCIKMPRPNIFNGVFGAHSFMGVVCLFLVLQFAAKQTQTWVPAVILYEWDRCMSTYVAANDISDFVFHSCVHEALC